MKNTASPAQASFLRKLGATDDLIATLDKRGASAEIERLLADQRANRGAKRAEENAKRAATSCHLGTVGERVELSLTLRARPSWVGTFGTTYCLIFDDAAGNVLVWKTANPPMVRDEHGYETRLETGAALTLVGTIKAHGERDGVAQTMITRCKVVEPGKTKKVNRAPAAKAKVANVDPFAEFAAAS